MTSNRDTPNGRPPPRHPVKTIIVFSVALAPLAIIPYVLVRRHALGLRTEIADLRKASMAAVKEVRMSTQETSQQHAAASKRVVELLKENRALLAGFKSEVEANRAAMKECETRLEKVENGLSELMATVKEIDREARIRASDFKNTLSVANTVAKERETQAQSWRRHVSATMEVLLKEKQRREGVATALGMSLADIASFMQEVEMRQGWVPRPDDGRGIERMRGLAKRLLEELTTTKQNIAEARREHPEVVPSPGSEGPTQDPERTAGTMQDREA
ncbi:hypothetical protein L226DRAFT_529532 [Lentinus tigrinus ALCF2SS1-7]|uniref:Uncharacterized protein n=1 Tax=Lentinus tigrinus ALCF2SS1-6 TaxID=1328759 RepID=A0A5C2SUI7_9APHY|nr:hypothetical protein L227DRAFT_559152 [Lentinus tigrinus ALCF2SS1-6]RPD81085.1 hypothetical protein L226DRAFT_529532 [Lentinus tigrinus ALCF2SS1-7]